MYFGFDIFSPFFSPKQLHSTALWNYASSTYDGCPVCDANSAPQRNKEQVSLLRFSQYIMLFRQWRHDFSTRSLPPDRGWMGLGSWLPCSNYFRLMDGSVTLLAKAIIQSPPRSTLQHIAASKSGTCNQPSATR